MVNGKEVMRALVCATELAINYTYFIISTWYYIIFITLHYRPCSQHHGEW